MLLRVPVVATMTVALLGCRRVTIVGSSRDIMGVLLVLRVSCVPLGMDGLLPDFGCRRSCSCKRNILSKDTTSDNFSNFSVSINNGDDDSSANDSVWASNVCKKLQLDVV